MPGALSPLREHVAPGAPCLTEPSQRLSSLQVSIQSLMVQRRAPDFPAKKGAAIAAAAAAAAAAEVEADRGISDRREQKQVALDEFGQPIVDSDDEGDEGVAEAVVADVGPLAAPQSAAEGSETDLLARGDSVWKLVVGTSLNEVFELTLPELICSPDDPAVTLRTSDTRKVYKSVLDAQDRPYPSLEVLVQTHAPGARRSGERCVVAAHPQIEVEVATCGPDAVLRVWDLDRGARISFPLADAAPELAAPPAPALAAGLGPQDSSASLASFSSPALEASAMAYSCASPSGDVHLAVGCRGCILVLDTKTSGDAPLLVALLDRAATGLAPKEAVTALAYSSPWGDVSKGRSTSVCNLAAGTAHGNIVLFAAQLDAGGEPYRRVAKVKAHPGAVVALDFSEAPEGSEPEWLRTNSADFELRFWGLQGGGGSSSGKTVKEKRPASELRDVLWRSNTCALSWPTTGLDADAGEEVPAVDRAPDCSACAAPAADGALQLFRYPCLRGAKPRRYSCHSPGVASVRFSSGGHNVFAMGANDLAVSFWRRLITPPPALLPLIASPVSALAPLDHELERREWERPENPAELAAPMFALERPFLASIKAFAQTGFDGIDLERFKSPEDLSARADLHLSSALGFRGGAALGTAHWAAGGGVVYATATLGVVQPVAKESQGAPASDSNGRQQQEQLLFKGHVDQILCVAMDPAGERVATGEVGPVARICVWGARDAEKDAVLEGAHQEGVGSLAFCSAAGGTHDLLASVGIDQDHCVVVWDLKAHAPLVRTTGDTRRILGVAWDPFFLPEDGMGLGRFVTVGDDHVTFWHVHRPELPNGGTAPPELARERGLLGTSGVAQTALCACFVQRSGTAREDEPASTEASVLSGSGARALTGMQSGDVYLWAGKCLVAVVAGAHKGPVLSIARLVRPVREGGSDEGALGAPANVAQALLATGGADGVVRVWDEQKLGDGSPAVALVAPAALLCAAGEVAGPDDSAAVHSLSARDGGDGRGIELLVGTRGNHLIALALHDLAAPEAADRAILRVLARGHAGAVRGLAMHPAEEAFATLGDDGLVAEWALDAHKPRAALTVRAGGGRSLSYRGRDGAELAIATHSGEVVVIGRGEAGKLTELLRRPAHRDVGAERESPPRHRNAAATVVQFDPTGTFLAVGFDDGTIELMLAPEGYRLVGRCSGHADALTHIDWSLDGEVLQTADASPDVYFWDLTKQVPAPVGVGGEAAPEYQRFGTPILLHAREWAAQSCPLAWPLQGMYTAGEEAEGLAAVAIDRGPGVEKGPGFALAAESSGAVRMFKYPCPPGSKPKVTARGHAAGVANVAISTSRTFAVSLGGTDQTALVWSIRGTGHLGD